MALGRRHLLRLALAGALGLGLAARGSAAPPATITSAAWVRVSVATVWVRPSSPRGIDAPALSDPAGIQAWLSGLTVPDRLGLDSRIQTQALLGEQVLVLGHRGTLWSRVEVPDQRGSGYPDGIVGWVPSRQLTAVGPQAESREAIVSATSTWVYSVSGGRVGGRLVLASYDTELPVVGAAPGYTLVGLPGGTTGAIAAGALAPVSDRPVAGAAVVAQARRFLGLPYLWGGTSAFGFDCSGLVYAVYARYGVLLPRDSADQRHAGAAVPLDRLSPGDLLFFAGPGGRGHVDHVAIYAGDGLMIDSPYSGASVELVPMTTSPGWSEFAGAIEPTGLTSAPAPGDPSGAA